MSECIVEVEELDPNRDVSCQVFGRYYISVRYGVVTYILTEHVEIIRVALGEKMFREVVKNYRTGEVLAMTCREVDDQHGEVSYDYCTVTSVGDDVVDDVKEEINHVLDMCSTDRVDAF